MSRGAVPKYRRHPNGSAFVQHRSIPNAAHRLYLGKYGSPQSIERYQQFLKRLAAGVDLLPVRAPTSQPTIDALIDAYITHAESYYQRADGPSQEYDAMVYALKPMHELFGKELAANFGPRCLVAIRKHMAQSGLARTNINRQIPRIKRFFRWCCEQEHVDPSLYHRLLCVRGLAKGQDGVRESKPIGPAHQPSIFGVLPFLSPVVAAMVEIQYRCCMRPSEVCKMRLEGISMNGDVWLYYPPEHKTEHRGYTLVKAIPKSAQSILVQWLSNTPYLFPPHRPRKAKKHSRNKQRLTLRERYTAETYRRAVDYGFRKASKNGVKLKRFSPNQLRHSIATFISQELGQQAAQRYAGHEDLNTTSIYVQQQVAELVSVARQLEERASASGYVSTSA